MEVLDAVIKILATPDIDSAMATLSDLSAEIFHAPAPSLFLLSTQQSAFVGVFGKQKGFVYLSNEPLPKERHIVGTRGELVIGFLEWEVPVAQMDDSARRVIKSAMPILSVAISNFLRYHEAKRMTDVIHDQLFSTTELEIAQSARHELQNIETEQALLIDELEALSRSARDKGILEPVSKLKDSVIKLDAAITKLRYSGVHAAPKLEKTSVAKVWNEAGDLIKERLNMMGIKLRYVGVNLEGYYYADWLREAFLNLLFNSIDAFRDRPRQNRTITLVIQKESDASQYNILDYSDSAGGIAFNKLTVPPPIKEANPGMSQEQLIFHIEKISEGSWLGVVSGTTSDTTSPRVDFIT